MTSNARAEAIQQEWRSRGKPHNIICSHCRQPGQLLPCATCCRAHHVACLPAPPPVDAVATGSWSCPACLSRVGVSPLSPSPRPGSPRNCQRARQFLSEHGLAADFSENGLLQLEQLINRADQSRELDQLRSENALLKAEIQRLRENPRQHLLYDSPLYDRRHSPSVPQGQGSDLDVAEKSWDRIISEAF
ncbi:hypothetical protein BGW36DRAFT_365220 [Talaromyces proteolyticus]|uniref:PHD-type domain-containing protein n=1 Tax=Talaromyces proteolyticus TaxID=1131652 RepID=A0AAD4KDT7_9EURO|nr:uncharacterized protein BGW36DRAFT_365220 [Talaromyces proteolyticus]KAH8689452.1 hypothetical protein BGW36DRAFT_365220 [Talaromyces proteolyticus]